MARVTLLLRADQREWLEGCVASGEGTGGMSAVVRALIDGVAQSEVDLPAAEARQTKCLSRLLWWGALVERCARRKRSGGVLPWLGKIRRAHLALENALKQPGVTASVIAHAGSIDLADVEAVLAPLMLSPPSDALVEKIKDGCKAIAATETRRPPKRHDDAVADEAPLPASIIPEAALVKLRVCLQKAHALQIPSAKISRQTRIGQTTIAAFERGEAGLDQEQAIALARWLTTAGILPPGG